MSAAAWSGWTIVYLGWLINTTWRGRVARRRLRPLPARQSPRWSRPRLRPRLRNRTGTSRPDLPAFLDAVARQCSTGDSLTASFAASAQSHSCDEVFAPALQSLAGGARLVEALDRQPVAGGEDVVLTWHVLSLCARNGGAVTEPLDRAAATIRSRQAIRHERAAHSAQARLSAKVLTLAPVSFALWVVVSAPTIRSFLLSSVGIVCVFLGAVLNAAGWLWMKRIVGTST